MEAPPVLYDHIFVVATIPVGKLHFKGTTPEQVTAELTLLIAFTISPDLLDV